MHKVYIAMLVVVSFFYTWVALANHTHFQTFAFDLGVYDQLIWKYSQGLPAVSSMLDNRPAFAIHFQPFFILLAPIFWLWNDVRALLIVQSVVLVAAAYPLFLLGRSILKHELLAASVAISYVFYFATQYTAFSDFHTDAFIPLFLAAAVLFAHKKRMIGYWVMVMLLLLLKEWVGFLMIAVGIVFLLQRRLFQGSGTILAGIFGFLIAYWVMNQSSPAGQNTIEFGFGELGRGPTDVIITLITKPWLAFQHLFLPTEKLSTIWSTIWPFGPFALLSPVWLLPILEQFGHRFYDLERPFRWGIGLHYSLPMGVLLGISTVYGLQRIPRKWFGWCAGILIVLTICEIVIFRLPILSLLKPQFYQEERWIADTRAALSMIPKDAAVATQNNLAPHLSHREKLYLLPIVGDAEYIAVDLHPGQSLYNFMTQSEGEMRQMVSQLRESEDWSVIFEEGDALVLRRSIK
ncbi:MAG: DUF2079 domain-containing protein [bacterium]|nr:DUF2079 domain-containing protein [bacterium]